MPSLQVLFADGRRVTRPLERSSPLTIGAQSFNDICIDDLGVPALACRIGWTKTGYEITAATTGGIEVNGTMVAHALLQNDDLIRIGSADAIFLDDAPAPSVKKPVPEAKPAPAAPPPPLAPKPEEPSLFEGPVYIEPSADDIEADDSEDQEPSSRRRERTAAPVAVAMAPRDVLGAPRRPGEEQVFKSPLILTLTTITVVLLMIAATLYLLMGRESQHRLFASGEKELAAGRYTQAIEAFEQFIKDYPTSQQRHAADQAVGQALVQRELAAAPPRWENAWKHLQELASSQRKSPDYADVLQPIVRDLSEQIALGAATGAETAAEEKLLTISSEALQLMERSTPPNSPESAATKQVLETSARARGAIIKRHAMESALTAMTTALETGDAITALATRQSLLGQYPQFAKDKRFEPLVQKALDVARKAVSSRDVDQDASTVDKTPSAPSVLPVVHARSRTDESSLGQVAYVVAADVCYAVDTVTGDVVWRRPIGTGPPFFPMTLREPKPSVLMYDTIHRQLVLCEARDGKVVWTQRMEHEPLGAPILHSGQAYVATRGGHLLRFDLSSGRISTEITFPQELASAPVLSPNGETLLVSGMRGLVYSLSTHPLACQAVTFTDHAEGNVRVPLLAMGRLFLLCDHDQADSTLLRVYREVAAEKPLVEESSVRIRGGVYDVPVLRGAQLVVPSQGERLAAFTVDDEPNRTALSPAGEYRVQEGYGGPLHVTLGPDQQFWMSSTAFRRFQFGTDSIKMETRFAAVGLTSQPLQAIGEMFFVGRRTSSATAVTFSNIDREKLTGTWRTVLGGKPIATTVTINGTLLEVTDAGSVFRLSASRLKQSGVEARSFEELELPANLSSPLLAERLPDGRIVVVANGTTSQWWVIETNGTVGKPKPLPEALSLPPLALDVGWVLPRPGRLTVLPSNTGLKLDDWRTPAQADSPAPWAAAVRLSGTELLIGDTAGRWRRLQVRTGDIPHLAEAQAVDLPPLLSVPRLCGDSLITLDEEGRLHRIDAQTLDDTAQRPLPAGAYGCDAVLDEMALAWSPGTLHGIPFEDFAAGGWTLALPDLRIVGRPLIRGDRARIATNQGVVITINWRTGTELYRETLPQSLSGELATVDGDDYTVAIDGAVYRLSDPMEVSP